MSPLALLLVIGATAVASQVNIEKVKPPEWSPVYGVKGVLSVPHAEIHEPFVAWYDSKNNKSRIDYYGGMVVTYQFPPSVYPPYGSLFQVVPVTTEYVLNQDTCFRDRGTAEEPKKMQSVLPDMTNFKFIGRDSGMYKWQMVERHGDRFKTSTVWVKYKKDSRGKTVPIPVRYEVKGADNFYFDYKDIYIGDIDPEVFYVDESQCKSIDDPLSQATFNPMKEFVHPVDDAFVEDEFNRFKNEYGKQYASENEHAERLNIFRQNLRFINSHNRANRGFTVAVNHLADWTDDELATLTGRRYMPRTDPEDIGLPFPYNQSLIEEMSKNLPTKFDWRTKGAVTPVKDQFKCGSCWSFGATGAVEGALFLHNGGHLKRLSEQALVDCSWGYDNRGCDGGEDYKAYRWIMKHGLPTDEDYGGYLAQDGYCHIDKVNRRVSIRHWYNVTANNEKALQVALFKHGPISVSIDADHKSLLFYSNGVYFEPKCKNKIYELDHSVLAVGYGILNGKKYWLIKNSWSNMWGNKGYVLMSTKNNNCGVLTCPTYVVM